MGRKLITVKCDLELPQTLDQLDWKAEDRDKLATLFAKYNFRTWLREVHGGVCTEPRRSR
jgi:DNA polymerase I